MTHKNTLPDRDTARRAIGRSIMAVATPIPPPLPTTTVVAPAPILKQARSPHAVKTLTPRAVDAPEKSEKVTGFDSRRQQRRGDSLDLSA
ncbi:MAG: hypothetical protein GVY13_14410 [Alphaproteobacteria bacterium]|jgi:hypothetical protein|nr:hypothetical protein [Alphaproteobacteria bacterium]